MSKKQLVLVLIGLVVIAAGAIFLIRYLTRPGAPEGGAALPLNTAAEPRAANGVPQSATKGVKVWTGVLNMGEKTTLKTDGQTYELLINKTDGGAILRAQGYKPGDEVNVMGKLTGQIVEVSGVNKLIR